MVIMRYVLVVGSSRVEIDAAEVVVDRCRTEARSGLGLAGCHSRNRGVEEDCRSNRTLLRSDVGNLKVEGLSLKNKAILLQLCMNLRKTSTHTLRHETANLPRKCCRSTLRVARLGSLSHLA